MRVTPMKHKVFVKKAKAFGFNLPNRKGSQTSHQKYVGYVNGEKRTVIVDGNLREFPPHLLRTMISQTGISVNEFLSKAA